MYVIQCEKPRKSSIGEYDHVRCVIVENYLVAIDSKPNGHQEEVLYRKVRETKQETILCKNETQKEQVEELLNRANYGNYWDFKTVDLSVEK